MTESQRIRELMNKLDEISMDSNAVSTFKDDHSEDSVLGNDEDEDDVEEGISKQGVLDVNMHTTGQSPSDRGEGNSDSVLGNDDIDKDEDNLIKELDSLYDEFDASIVSQKGAMSAVRKKKFVDDDVKEDISPTLEVANESIKEKEQAFWREIDEVAIQPNFGYTTLHLNEMEPVRSERDIRDLQTLGYSDERIGRIDRSEAEIILMHNLPANKSGEGRKHYKKPDVDESDKENKLGSNNRQKRNRPTLPGKDWNVGDPTKDAKLYVNKGSDIELTNFPTKRKSKDWRQIYKGKKK